MTYYDGERFLVGKKIKEEDFPLKRKLKSKPSFSSDNKKTRNVKIAFIALFLLLLFILLSKLIGFFTSLNQPISPLVSNKQYIWDERSVVNILTTKLSESETSETNIVSYFPEEKRIVVLNVAQEMYVTLPKDLGSMRVDEVYATGQKLDPAQGSLLLSQAISKTIGLPIDGIVIFPEDYDKSTDQLVSEIKTNRLQLLGVLNSVQSDMHRIELAKLLWEMSSVRADKIETLNLERSNITQSKLLPDTSRVLGVDTVKLDLFIRDKMADPTFASEETTVAIFNGTNQPGIGGELSRMLTNIGVNVVTVSSTTEPVAQSVVLTSDDLGAESIAKTRLTNLFAPWCLKKECVSLDSKVNSARAQIIIVLGEDYVKSWYKL